MKRLSKLLIALLIVAAFDWKFIAAHDATAQESGQGVNIAVPSATPTPIAALPESSQVLEIQLPQTFAGCWSGAVTGANRIPPIPEQLEKRDISYTFCFKRLDSGQWQMTLAGSSLYQGLKLPPGLATIKSNFALEGIEGNTARILFTTSTSLTGTPIVVGSEMLFRCTPTGPGTMRVEEITDYFQKPPRETGAIPQDGFKLDFHKVSGGDADGTTVDSGSAY
ncbi:MAG: hypothetical protein ACREQR_02005 [Candidatus Binataceae bacterium]